MTDMLFDNLSQAVSTAKSPLSERLTSVVIISTPGDSPETISVITVTAESADIISHERIVMSLKGTGDLFCAELMSHMLEGMPIAYAGRVFTAITWIQKYQLDELILPPQS